MNRNIPRIYNRIVFIPVRTALKRVPLRYVKPEVLAEANDASVPAPLSCIDEPSVVSTSSDDMNSTRTKGHILLIDGNPMIFRAWHTMPAEMRSNGMRIGALFGYTRLLIKLLRQFGLPRRGNKPMEPEAGTLRPPFGPATHVALMLDAGGSTFRHDLYAEYKAHRPDVDVDLISQLRILPDVAKAFGLPLVMEKGYEADDYIAAYARRAVEQHYNVTIVSSDKDLCQLIDERTILLDPVKRKFVHVADVEKRYGVPPRQMAELQALAGDSVDNVPGVPSIGLKRAAKLLGDHGSLDRMLERLQSDDGDVERNKFTQAVLEHVEQLRLSERLVRLRDDLDLPIDLNALHQRFDLKELVAFLERFGFRAILASVSRDFASFVDSSHRTAEERIQMEALLSTMEAQPRVIDRIELDAEYSARADDATADEMDTLDADETGDADESANLVLTMETSRMEELKPSGVTLVRDRETARRVVRQLRSLAAPPNGGVRYHACDTETIGIDVKKQTPVGNGQVICLSIFCGADVDFGDGPRLFVDNLNECAGVLDEFKEYFEDESILKVWHNYAFDRHVLYNHGIDVRGFGADTMHMARLWDAARMMGGGYSLEALSSELLQRGKRPMKDRFGAKRIRMDGTEGADTVMPTLDLLQRSEIYIHDWIDYSCYDTEATFYLREDLERRLMEQPWTWPEDDQEEVELRAATASVPKTMFHYYDELWRPFGELLTDMERAGIRLDATRLAELTPLAWQERDEGENRFRQWASKYSVGALEMNVGSDAQKQQLLFAPCANRINKQERMPATREFQRANTEGFIKEGQSKANKNRSFVIEGMGMPAVAYTKKGWPSVNRESLLKLARSPDDGQEAGVAYTYFARHYGEEAAEEACTALRGLCESTSIGTLLSTFIEPLQGMADANGRVHSSINIATETGRLSSRRPNLQNQPALEKDRFGIRRAFVAAPGNVLIVADYSQLELRLLAHMTRCQSMLEAFHSGGDFHSRTALGMYPHIAEAVKSGKVLLEGDGDARVPLLKDVYSMERKRAKTLNFSIAYGKTARGLAQDWETSLKEAKETLEAWYADRPEVREWQQKTIEIAREYGYTKTLMGRYRPLPGIRQGRGRAHAERAAINTPLQGGAADIVMAAMLRIARDDRMRQLGFFQVLQVHDELILEGPEEHAEEALSIVFDLMRHPIPRPLLVDLDVDGKFAMNWGDAK